MTSRGAIPHFFPLLPLFLHQCRNRMVCQTTLVLSCFLRLLFSFINAFFKYKKAFLNFSEPKRPLSSPSRPPSAPGRSERRAPPLHPPARGPAEPPPRLGRRPRQRCPPQAPAAPRDLLYLNGSWPPVVIWSLQNGTKSSRSPLA